MKKYCAMLLAVVALAGCSSAPTVVPPSSQESSALGVFVKVRVSGWATYRADVVYFVKRCSGSEPCDVRLRPSSYSKDGRVYLLNAEPGEYLAVAAAFESGMPGDQSLYFVYFPQSLIDRSATSIRSSGLTYAGAYAIEASLGVCPENAEPVQLKFAQMIEPDTPKCGFWQPVLSKLAKGDFIFVGGKAYAVGKQTFHHRALSFDVSRSETETSEFFERAQSDLSGAGWRIAR